MVKEDAEAASYLGVYKTSTTLWLNILTLLKFAVRLICLLGQQLKCLWRYTYNRGVAINNGAEGITLVKWRFVTQTVFDP